MIWFSVDVLPQTMWFLNVRDMYWRIIFGSCGFDFWHILSWHFDWFCLIWFTYVFFFQFLFDDEYNTHIPFKILWLVTWNMLKNIVATTVSTIRIIYLIEKKNTYNELWSHKSTNLIQQISFKIMLHS